MRKVLRVARHEFSTNCRRPGFIFMTLFVPFLGLVAAVLTAVAGGRVSNFLEQQFAPEMERVAYVDHRGLFTPALPPYQQVFVQYADETQALLALREGREQTVIVIPSNYLENGKITVYSLRKGLSSQLPSDSQLLRSFLVDHLVAGRLDPGIVARLKDPYQPIPVMLDKDGRPSSQGVAGAVLGFVIPYLLAILLIMTIFTSSGYLLQGVSVEKDSRVVEILISSVTSTQLMAGKILGLGALGLAQVLFWVSCGWGLLSATTGMLAPAGGLPISLSQVSLSIVYFLLGHLLFGTLMAAAGALGTSMREGQQIAGFLSVGAALPFTVISFIFANPNSGLAVALSWFPLTAPVTMLVRIGMTQVPSYQLLISVALLLASVAAGLWAGAKVFRLGLLMYGKRPSPKEIWHALREA